MLGGVIEAPSSALKCVKAADTATEEWQEKQPCWCKQHVFSGSC